MKRNSLIYMAVASSILTSTVVSATEFRSSTVRALGMGGSNIASTNGVDATYWNPAAYGFFGESDDSAETKSVDNSRLSEKSWGMDLSVDAGGKAFGPLDKNTTILKSLINPSTIPTGQLTTNVGQTVADVAAFSKGIASLDPSPMGVGAFADVGSGIRIGSYGINVRGTLDVGGTVVLDNQNARLDVLTAVVGGNITVGAAGTLAIAPNGFFTAAQRTNMLNQLTSPAGGLTADAAASVIIGYEAALTANNGGISAAAAEGNLISAATAPGDITKNNTAWALRGALVKELGVTYGHAINDRLSIGGVLKYMQAELFDYKTDILGTTGNTATSNNGATETSTGFGLDLGVMYRMPSYQFGLTVRNINAPSFTYSATGYTYKMDPQAKVGAAWMPSRDFTLELGYDVTKNKGVIETDESQYVNLGLEWDAWHVLALRAGAYQNLAQSDIGLVATAGLGLNLWAVRLDIAGAISSNKVTFEGKDVPAYAMASLALSSDF
ncbi:conjugal transfer protein TraF [Ghiorsea bivora]|uniref:conjugal transfer protein TraF n=1 Tax=Ghiorsea bivora TaxID=1485545 RepID=UPI00056E96E0|nr:conjugal transfer protein TraF [Ghiorsea bivora]